MTNQTVKAQLDLRGHLIPGDARLFLGWEIFAFKVLRCRWFACYRSPS